MNREIKFRAWDEGNKVMHLNFQFFTSGDGGNDWICFSSNKEPRDTQTVKHGILFDNPYFRQQLKIMQFTGLIDKNGLTEVYEGDILDENGLVKGNVYESPQIHREGIDLVVAGMGTSSWRSTESVAMGRGCKYSE